MSCPHFPSREEGVGLHARCLSNDPTVWADVCVLYLPPLVGWLVRVLGGLDEHQVQTAAEDAVLSYLRNPGCYKPEKGDLGCFLCVAARADLRNLWRAERGRRLKIVRNFVASDEWGGNLPGKEEVPGSRLERQEEVQKQARWFERVGEGFTAEERAVLGLMREGEDRLEVHAAALGLGEKGRAEQKRAVKRVRDRVLKRLQRGGKKHG